MSPSLRIVIAAAILCAAVHSQSPLFAEIGEPIPDGVGQAIGVGDVDLDGDVDLYTTVGVFLNAGGFFTPGPVMPATFVVGTNMRAIQVADFTGDGRPD